MINTAVEDATQAWLADAASAMRRLGTITAAAAVSSLIVGGIGGRLAMLLLARINPAATGIESDDDFVMGQFTVKGTANLMLVALVLGLVGALVYAVVRGLMIGPRWFQVASVAVGAGVTVGAFLVHRDGVDFVLLQPAALSIALFVAIPLLYAASLTWLAERWLRPESGWSRIGSGQAMLPLVLLVLVAPAVPVVALLWIAARLMRQSRQGAAALDSRVAPWCGRLALTAVFGVQLQDLLADTVALV